ncbi:MAG: hypothetical protein HY321_01235 [Armatimonadetes bacterium]|nr:hypothetical protein [Armatimonadota bacterium]
MSTQPPRGTHGADLEPAPLRWEHLETAGSWYDIGLVQGRAMRTAVRCSIHLFLKEMGSFHAGSDRLRALGETTRRVERFLARRFPEEWAELNGLADGAEVPLPWLVAGNFPAALARVCADAAPPPAPEEACSGVIFPDSEWGPLLGGTLDCLPLRFLMSCRPEGGVPFCCNMWPGMVWATWGGMNGAGLALSGASAQPRREQYAWQRDTTLGLDHLTSQRVLLRSCRTVAEALDRLGGDDVLPPPGNLGLLDRTGRAVLIEGYERDTPTLRIREMEEGDGLCWGNYFPWDVRPDDCGDLPEAQRPLSAFSRVASLRRALDEHRESYSVAAMVQLLSSHDSGAHSPDGDAHNVCNNSNVLAMLAAPAQGKVLFASKPPCVQGFVEYPV